MGVFVAGVPSSLAPRTPFFSRVLAPLPLPHLRLLRRLNFFQFVYGYDRDQWINCLFYLHSQPSSLCVEIYPSQFSLDFPLWLI